MDHRLGQAGRWSSPSPATPGRPTNGFRISTSNGNNFPLGAIKNAEGVTRVPSIFYMATP